MKTALLGLLAMMATGASAQAGAPADVPRDHWAYPAVDALFRAGILHGYPDGNFRGSRPASRYDLASAMAAVDGAIRARLQGAAPGRTDLGEIRRRLAELRLRVDALKAQGPEIEALKTRYAGIGARIAELRRQIEGIRGEGANLRRSY